MRVLFVHNAVSVRLILVSIAYFRYLHATVLQTAIVWIGISRHWKQNDLSAHTYVFARWLFPFTTTYQIVVHMHVVESSIVARARGRLSRRLRTCSASGTLRCTPLFLPSHPVPY